MSKWVCAKGGQWKEEREDFYRNQLDACKSCKKEYAKRWYAAKKAAGYRRKTKVSWVKRLICQHIENDK